jgi:parallel beta-helix repeat protein
MRKAIIFSLAFLLLLPLARADTYLTDCATLDTSGETYYLTQDIINSTASTCMNITAHYVTLDCQGHIINTNITDIYTANTGIYVLGTGIVIKNCILTGWFTGIYTAPHSTTVLQNLTIISRQEGIRLERSDFATLTDVAISNATWGLNSQSSDYTSVFNSTIKDNFLDVFYSTTRAQMYCHSYFENVTGTGDKPIVFFNSTVEIRDWDNNASEIILCGADNSIVDNLRMNNNDLQVIASNNVTVANSSFNNTSWSIHLRFSDNNTISNSNISGITGIYLYYANYNTISNSIVENCSTGIYLRNSANNLIYNNLFNNTNNFYFSGTIYPNYWNTTRQAGTRVYSFGNEIGGNYWTNPDGNGYSDICRDTDGDSFCDSPYTLATDNVDYLAYSKWYGSPTWGAPRWSDNSTFITYGDLSFFNITWDDSPGYSIDTVLFESNFSGTPTNYTMTLIDPYINETERKGVYSFSDTLPAGTFYWKSYAQASDGTWNSTDTWYFTTTSPTTTLPPVHGVPLLSSTLVGLVIGSGIIIFMLRTLFDIREPKKVIEYFIVLAVIVLTVISLIALFG